VHFLYFRSLTKQEHSKSSAALSGAVTDPSGSAVANAKVTITDITNGTSFEVMTNDSGQYSKGQLIPDVYKVAIEAPGFQKVVSNDLTVSVDQSTRFDTAMRVGDLTQTVEVTAAAPLLQTDKADVAQTFTAEQIAQIPNIGRNLVANARFYSKRHWRQNLDIVRAFSEVFICAWNQCKRDPQVALRRVLALPRIYAHFSDGAGLHR
jgi:hypothetical protein